MVGSILTLPLFGDRVGAWVSGRRLVPTGWLSLGFACPSALRRAFLPGRMEPAKDWQLEYGHPGGAGFDSGVRYSAWGLFTEARGHLFFMESASIITLISIGHWVESKVSARAAKSLRALLNLTPPTARWLDPGGAEVEVPVSQLKAGDQVVIKPGDRVPIDSEVAEGASVVDESMLTGESTPVSKNKGARIYGGTVNLHGWLLGKVAAKAKPRRWRRLSPSCSAPKPAGPISKLGDRVRASFVPIVG